MRKTLYENLKQGLKFRDIGFRQIVAVTILSMIVMVFVFFGYSAQDSLGVGAAAQINGTVISAGEFQRELSRMEQMYAPFLEQMGGGKQQREFIQSQALDNIINQEIAFQASKRIGIHISDAEIIQVITQDIAAFQEEGKFKRERYEGVLRANQWTPGEFEKQVKKEKSTKRLQQLVDFAIAPSELEKQLETQLSQKQKNIEFLSWDASEWVQQVKLNPTSLPELLRTPEFKEKVKMEFDSKKEALGQNEQVRARHILVKAQGEGGEAEALAKIKLIKAQLATKSFEALAKQYSEDEGSNTKGGDLDFFSRGAMVPEFEQYAFSAELGKVSEPIKSQFGYHLIEVTDKKPAKEASYADHEMDLAKQVWAREKYDQELKKLEDNLAAKNVPEVAAQIKSWGLKWEESGYFTLSDEVAGRLPSSLVSERAWELNSKNPYLTQLVRDGGKVYLVRFKSEQKNLKGSDESKIGNIAQAKGNEILGRYLQNQKDRSKIVKNPQILRN